MVKYLPEIGVFFFPAGTRGSHTEARDKWKLLATCTRESVRGVGDHAFVETYGGFKPDSLALHVESAPALPASGPGIGSTRFRPSCRLLGSEPRSRDAATSPFDRRRPLPPRPSAPKRREGCGSRAAWSARPSATTDRKGHLCGPARRRHEAGGAVERTAIPGEEPTCRVFHSVHPCGRAR
jgi:hypothetical protein